MSKIMGILLTILFIAFPLPIKEGVLYGLKNSLLALFPALFPYMVISSVFLSSGGLEAVSEILYKPINKLTGFSKNASGGLLLSLFCGYPTGARISSQMYKEGLISEKEMQRLFMLGNIPGFGYCIALLGSTYGNGLKIYFSFIASSIILNRIFSLGEKNKEEYTGSFFERKPISLCITDSVKISSAAMVSICGFVCFFSALSALMGIFIKNRLIHTVFCSFAEISMGADMIHEYFPLNIGKYLAVFFTGFSGFSIIFQSLSFRQGKINVLLLLVMRLLYAAVSLLIFFIL